jgi:hypothetical protein
VSAVIGKWLAIISGVTLIVAAEDMVQLTQGGTSNDLTVTCQATILVASLFIDIDLVLGAAVIYDTERYE